MISAFISFFRLGVEHILTGYDHLLFIFSLLIARQTIKQYASVITAFTIAHCLTLTLTVLDIINVPSSIVEPAIALSICYVAIENICQKRREKTLDDYVCIRFNSRHGVRRFIKGHESCKKRSGFKYF